MKVIWKFPIESPQFSRITLPVTKFLHVGLDPKGQLSLWAVVEDTNLQAESHSLAILMTGEKISDEVVTRGLLDCYLNTFESHDGIVCHVFVK